MTLPKERLYEHLFAVPVGSKSRPMLKLLIDRYPGTVSNEDLAATVYEPGYEKYLSTRTRTVVRIRVTQLRKLLEPFGWTISRNNGGWRGRGEAVKGRYALEPFRTPASYDPSIDGAGQTQQAEAS